MAEFCKWNNDNFRVFTMIEACQSKDAGIFIFAERKTYLFTIDTFVSYFIGETDNFQTLKSHPLWTSAKKRGATHVHLFTVGEKDRKFKIDQLVRMHNPPLNLLKSFSQPVPM